MNFLKPPMKRSTVMQDGWPILQKPLEEAHIDIEKPENLNKTSNGIRKIKFFNNGIAFDNRVARVFLKKHSRVAVSMSSNNEPQKPIPHIPAMPQAPRIFKDYRFIASLNSSKNLSSSQTMVGPRLPTSKNSRPTVNKGESPFLGLRRLSIVSLHSKCPSHRPRSSRIDSPAISKERKSRLELEMNRNVESPTRSTRSRILGLDESLNNQYVRFKCFESIAKVARDYRAIKN